MREVKTRQNRDLPVEKKHTHTPTLTHTHTTEALMEKGGPLPNALHNWPPPKKNMQQVKQTLSHWRVLVFKMSGLSGTPQFQKNCLHVLSVLKVAFASRSRWVKLILPSTFIYRACDRCERGARKRPISIGFSRQHHFEIYRVYPERRVDISLSLRSRRT